MDRIAAQRRWRSRNLAKSREWTRHNSQRYRLEHPEQARESGRLRAANFRKAHPERAALMSKKATAKKKYGPDYDRDVQLASQEGKCAICGRTDCVWKKGFNNAWHTDHNHDLPGTHRGVLCGRCNTALGRLEPHMDKVVAYLAKYAAEQRAPRTEAAI